MTIISKVVLSADSTGIRKAKTDLDQMQGSANKSQSTVASLGKTIAGLASAAAIGLATRSVVDYTNRWTDLNSKLVNATGSQQAADRAMMGISQTARSTYSSLEATANAFLRNSMTLTELGYTTQRQIELSDSLNNSLVISGTKGIQAESVMNALSKAFAVGKLSGENFNSVIANGGRTVQALADGLGVATIDLRAMAEAGELTTGRVVEALTSQMGKLREEAEAMPATIGDGFLLLGNAMFETVGRMDTMLGVSSNVSGVLVELADRLSGVSDGTGEFSDLVDSAHSAVIALSVGVGTLGAIHLVQFVASMRLATAAQLAFNLAAKVNPYVMLATGVAALTYGLIQYTKEQDNATSALGRFLQKGMSNDEMIEAIGLMVDENGKLVDSTEAAAAAAQKYHDSMRPNIDVTADMLAGVGGLAVVMRNATRITNGYGESVEFTHDAHDAHLDTMQDYIKEQEKSTQAAKDQEKSVLDMIDALEIQRQLIGMTEREQAIFNATAQAYSNNAAPAQIAKITELVGANYDLAEANKATGRAAEDAAKQAQENWQRTHEYMTVAFIDLMDNGGNAFDNIAKSFERMVKRMVAEWAASGLMGMLSGNGLSGFSMASLTGSSGSGAATASSVLGSIFGGGAGSSMPGGVAGSIGIGSRIAGAAGSIGSAIGGAASSAGSAIMTAASAIPGWGWALAGGALLAKTLSKDPEPYGNAGFLIRDVAGASDRTFDVPAFDSGFDPVGFARREDRSSAIQNIDIFRQYDSAATAIARAAGLSVNYNSNNFGGFNEKGHGNGLFFGDASEGGKNTAVPIERQLDQYMSQWFKGLGGQVDPDLISDVLAQGSADAMIARAAQLAGVDGSHAGGLNYVPFDGYRAELHKGERVLTASESAQMSSMSGMSSKLEQLTMQVALYSRRMSQVLDDWNTIGLPPERAA